MPIPTPVLAVDELFDGAVKPLLVSVIKVDEPDAVRLEERTLCHDTSPVPETAYEVDLLKLVLVLGEDVFNAEVWKPEPVDRGVLAVLVELLRVDDVLPVPRRVVML